MSLPVYLVPTLAGVSVGEIVEVTGDEAHHAVVVRRTREGEAVVLTDGRGAQVTGEVVAVGKRAMKMRVDTLSRSAEPTPAIWVVQAVPKGERGERAVEVLTEIGVSRILPWAAERSVGQWRGERAEKSLAKWRSTARESGKQARRTWAAEVVALIDTPELVGLVQEVDLALVLHEEGADSFADVAVPSEGTILIIVGPEGGLTEGEVSALTEVGAVPVRLGSEILRTSTAGVVASAAVLSRTRRWRDHLTADPYSEFMSEPQSDCIFCRIVSGEIPADFLHESATAIAFSDQNPQAPTHVLIVPKAHYPNAANQVATDSGGVNELVSVAGKIAEQHGLEGYRLVFNTGADGGQTVFHTHLHLLGGRAMTWPPG